MGVAVSYIHIATYPQGTGHRPTRRQAVATILWITLSHGETTAEVIHRYGGSLWITLGSTQPVDNPVDNSIGRAVDN